MWSFGGAPIHLPVPASMGAPRVDPDFGAPAAGGAPVVRSHSHGVPTSLLFWLVEGKFKVSSVLLILYKHLW